VLQAAGLARAVESSCSTWRTVCDRLTSRGQEWFGSAGCRLRDATIPTATSRSSSRPTTGEKAL